MHGERALKNMRTDVKIVTANYTFQQHLDEGVTFSNKGAAGTVIVTLGKAKIGAKQRFIVETAEALQIDPATGEKVSLHTGVLQVANANIDCSTVGAKIEFECVKTGEWRCTNSVGTWALVS